MRFLDAVRAGRPHRAGDRHPLEQAAQGRAGRATCWPTQLAEVDGLAEFDHPLGYRYDPDLTEVADDGIRVTVTLVKR